MPCSLTAEMLRYAQHDNMDSRLLKNGAGGCFDKLSTGSAPSKDDMDFEKNGGLGSSRAVGSGIFSNSPLISVNWIVQQRAPVNYRLQ